MEEEEIKEYEVIETSKNEHKEENIKATTKNQKKATTSIKVYITHYFLNA